MNLEWLNLYTYFFVFASVIFVAIVFFHLLKISLKNEKESDIDWLTTPENKITIEDNIEMAYRQHGHGADLLLIHGIGANTFCWRRIHDQLCKKFKVTTIDLPGFGYSSKNPSLQYGLDEQAQRVRAFIKANGLKSPILVGSSMGGTIALWLALKEPQVFKKVVAISPAAGVRLIPPIFRKIQSVSYFLNWGLNRKTMVLILKRVLAKRSLVSNYTVDGYLKPYLKDKTNSIHCFVNSKNLIMDSRLPMAFRELKITPLIITGKKDKMVKKTNIKELLSYIPSYDFALSPLGGHHLMEDEPEWVLSQTFKYLYK